MSIERVAVTGGNGKIGGAILSELTGRGYETVNVGRGDRRESVADDYRSADLVDADATADALAASDADAVVHMGTIPSPVDHPGHVTFESNAMSAYHVLNAAADLGFEAVVLPSSINVMGADYQDAPTEVSYLPVDEDHPLTPRDPYALGKQTTEALGEGFARRSEMPQIASLRYPWVATSEQLRSKFTARNRSLASLGQAPKSRSTLFSYLHIADAATIARRAIEADFDGHEAFWAVAADTNAAVTSARLVEAFYEEATVRGNLNGNDALISIEKARSMLDWTPEYSWRDL